MSEGIPLEKYESEGSGTKHNRFFLADGNVYFMVEKVLYSVHRYFFQQYSPVFASMFTLPNAIGKPVEGASEDNPIILEGIKTHDFDQLLSVFYPIDFADTGKSVEDWKSILALATRWEFTSVRQLALDRLLPIITPIDKVELAQTYDLHDWLIEACVDICERLGHSPLTREDGRRLGVDMVVDINRVWHLSTRKTRHVFETNLRSAFQKPITTQFGFY